MSIVAGAVTILCRSIPVEVVAEQAFTIGLIAAGAAIGLGLGAGLCWLVSAQGARRRIFATPRSAT